MTEVDFDIFPPGLRGLNRLASRLNALMANKQISDGISAAGATEIKRSTA